MEFFKMEDEEEFNEKDNFQMNASTNKVMPTDIDSVEEEAEEVDLFQYRKASFIKQSMMDSMMMGVPKTWEFFNKLDFNAQELQISGW